MPIIRTLCCAAAIIALAGCASPSSPTASRTTAKTPEEYAACVLPKWQAVAPQATQESIARGYRIKVSSALASDEVLEIVKQKSGSRVTFYRGGYRIADKLRLAARSCL